MRSRIVARKIWLTVLAVALPGSAVALSSSHGPWDAQAELGTIVNSGNSSSMNVNGKLVLEYENDRWHDKGIFQSQYGSNEGKRTEERYLMNAESRYRISEFMYVYGNGEAIRQHFKPYDAVYSESIGLGRRFLQTERFALDVQGGPGGRHSREAGSDTTEHNLILETATAAKWKLTRHATFLEEISSKSGKDNTFAKATTSLTTKFVENLGLKLSYVLEYNSRLPEQSDLKKHFDSTTSLTMVYDF